MGSINRHSQDTKDLVIREYDSGKTIAAISRVIGVSEPTITKWLKIANVDIRPSNGRSLKLDVDKVNQLYDAGSSTYRIAKALGCSDETVRKLIKQPKTAHGPHSPETKQKLRERSLALWQTDSYRQTVAASTGTASYKAMLSQSGRAHSARLIAMARSPEGRRAAAERSKQCWADQLYRDKQSAHNDDRSKAMTVGFRDAMADPDRRKQWVDKLRIASAGNLSKRGWVSSAQRQLYFILTTSGIVHHEEGSETAVGPFYVVDCVIPKQQQMKRPLIVEVQGEYWHSLPHVQLKDRQKKTYIRKHTDYDLLYLSDLNVRSMGEVTAALGTYGLTTKIERCTLRDLILSEIDHEQADLFYSVFHYSGKARKGSISYGLRLHDELVAAISYSRPIRQETATRLECEYGEVFEISRIARQSNLECPNLISYLIGRTRGLLPANTHKIVSFSDSTFGHTGGVYKAAGFVNDGEVEADYCYISMCGRYHKKTIWDRSKKFLMSESEYAEKHGLVKLYGEPKTRWIYTMGEALQRAHQM